MGTGNNWEHACEVEKGVPLLHQVRQGDPGDLLEKQGAVILGLVVDGVPVGNDDTPETAELDEDDILVEVKTKPSSRLKFRVAGRTAANKPWDKDFRHKF